MKRLITYCIVVASVAVMMSCDANEYADYKSQLVVEGWIESGRAPVVVITRNIRPSAEATNDNALRNYVSGADVTVSVDGVDYRLDETRDDRFCSAPVYTNGDLIGQEGARYRLEIKYDDELITAITQIPKRVEPDSVVAKATVKANKFELRAYIHDERQERRYYKIFINRDRNKSECYHGTYMGDFDNATFKSNDVSLPVYPSKMLSTDDYSIYFQLRDTVDVKFCTVDSTTYQYWTDYEKVVELSRVSLFNVRDNLRSNVHGGLGYWSGLASARIRVVCGQ